MAQSKTDPTTSAPAPDTSWYQSNPFELIRPSWLALKLNWKSYLWYLLSILGAVLVIGLLVAAAIFGYQKSVALGIVATVLGIVALVATLLYFPWALTRLTIASARGERLSLGDSWPTLSLASKLFGTEVLYGLVIIGGFILLIIPGLIFMAWFSMSQYVAVEENIYGVAALRRSRELVRGRIWDMWGTLSLPSALSIVAVVPILGPIVSIILSVILTPLGAIRYVQLKKLKSLPEVPKIPVSPWNFVVIILAIAVGGVSDFSAFAPNNSTSVEKSLKSY